MRDLTQEKDLTLQAELEDSMTEIKDLRDDLELAKREIESWHSLCEAYLKEAKRRDKEIKKLRAQVEGLRGALEGVLDAIDRYKGCVSLDMSNLHGCVIRIPRGEIGRQWNEALWGARQALQQAQKEGE